MELAQLRTQLLQVKMEQLGGSRASKKYGEVMKKHDEKGWEIGTRPDEAGMYIMFDFFVWYYL